MNRANDSRDLNSPERDSWHAWSRRRQRWRKIRRVCYLLVASWSLLLGIAFVTGYMVWDVPNPDAVGNQTVAIRYTDNSELTRIVPASGNRSMIRNPSEVSPSMRAALIAAEDATFYENPGFSVEGLTRAVWAQITGGSESGGSTLTQQYIKLATGNDQHTFTRKFKEIVLAVKMNQQRSKDEILAAYLNTAYYGRGANGIRAAADTYFHKQPKDLDASEAALLAGMVQQPTNNDPRINLAQDRSRFTYVADQMARNQFVTPQQRAAMRLPATGGRGVAGGPDVAATRYLIREQVLAELDREGFREQDLEENGYSVVTTIDPQAQKAAEDAVNRALGEQPDTLHPALVAVEAGTGSVRAYYGGGGTTVGGFNYATAPVEPGAVFRPFVALAAAEHGVGSDMLGGLSNFYSVPAAVLEEWTARGINPADVADVAHRAGIPRQDDDGTPTLQSRNGRIDPGIADGMYPASATAMANAYATIASHGMRAQTHFVQKVVDSEGNTVRDFTSPAQPAFDPSDWGNNKKIADGVTTSLSRNPGTTTPIDRQRIPAITGVYPSGDYDPRYTAWKAGYTARLSTVISLSAGDDDHPALPLPASGEKLPGQIWDEFMRAHIAGKTAPSVGRPAGKPKPPRAGE